EVGLEVTRNPGAVLDRTAQHELCVYRLLRVGLAVPREVKVVHGAGRAQQIANGADLRGHALRAEGLLQVWDLFLSLGQLVRRWVQRYDVVRATIPDAQTQRRRPVVVQPPHQALLRQEMMLVGERHGPAVDPPRGLEMHELPRNERLFGDDLNRPERVANL